MSECDSRLFTGDALSSKGLKYLLEGRLNDAVILNTKNSFLALYLSKEPSDSPILSRSAQFEVLTALFKDFNLLEVSSKLHHDIKAEGLSLQVL